MFWDNWDKIDFWDMKYFEVSITEIFETFWGIVGQSWEISGFSGFFLILSQNYKKANVPKLNFRILSLAWKILLKISKKNNIYVSLNLKKRKDFFKFSQKMLLVLENFVLFQMLLSIQNCFFSVYQCIEKEEIKEQKNFQINILELRGLENFLNFDWKSHIDNNKPRIIRCKIRIVINTQ